jgi:hypothetical protein
MIGYWSATKVIRLGVGFGIYFLSEEELFWREACSISFAKKPYRLLAL